MAKDVKTAAYVILRNHLENAKFNELEDSIVNAMMEYAVLRLRKSSDGNPINSKDGNCTIFDVSGSLSFDEPIFMDWINKYFDHAGNAGNDDLYKDKNSGKVYPQKELYKKYKKAYDIL